MLVGELVQRLLEMDPTDSVVCRILPEQRFDGKDVKPLKGIRHRSEPAALFFHDRPLHFDYGREDYTVAGFLAELMVDLDPDRTVQLQVDLGGTGFSTFEFELYHEVGCCAFLCAYMHNAATVQLWQR